MKNSEKKRALKQFNELTKNVVGLIDGVAELKKNVVGLIGGVAIILKEVTALGTALSKYSKESHSQTPMIEKNTEEEL